MPILSPKTMEKYNGSAQPKKDFEPKTFTKEDTPIGNEKILSEIRLFGKVHVRRRFQFI